MVLVVVVLLDAAAAPSRLLERLLFLDFLVFDLLVLLFFLVGAAGSVEITRSNRRSK